MIDNRAIIDESAKIAKDVVIGPWSIVGAEVEIGSGTVIGPHVCISAKTKIGKNNKIYQFSSIGEDPQSLDFAGESTSLEIGDDNIIREFCTLNRGTQAGGSVTRIGNKNFIMAYAHIAHDCQVGNSAVFANNASLAGHVKVRDHVVLGAFTGIHQFCTIGSYSFLGRGCKVYRDILPYMMVVGNPAVHHGLNSVGLKRHGFQDAQLSEIRKAFRVLFKQGLPWREACSKVKEMSKKTPELTLMLDLMDASERGIAR